MGRTFDADRLIAACENDSFESGIRIAAALEPQAGPNAPVKPAVYEGGRYQIDQRWPSPDAPGPEQVIVIDNVPSQANRLEAALAKHGNRISLPRIVLDLSHIDGLPVHLPRQLDSLQFPHRNADAYLRDADLDGAPFRLSVVGAAIESATPDTSGPLVSWFPQALLLGFWQSHLGKHRQQTKHARAWTSEITGWSPASTSTKTLGLKGDALNLTGDVKVTSAPDNRVGWTVGEQSGGKADRLSEIGHGQVPFMRESDASPAAVSFARITQNTTLSFSQLRRISLGPDVSPAADARLRALVAALGLFAHAFAFGGGFSLRSGADLRTTERTTLWLGATSADDSPIEFPTPEAAQALVEGCLSQAREAGVPLDGWGTTIMLQPNNSLRTAIEKTWPGIED